MDRLDLFPANVLLDVTEADFWQGCRGNARDCAFARALARHFGNGVLHTLVGPSTGRIPYVGVVYLSEAVYVRYLLSSAATKVAQDYDVNNNYRPGRYKLTRIE